MDLASARCVIEYVAVGTIVYRGYAREFHWRCRSEEVRPGKWARDFEDLATGRSVTFDHARDFADALALLMAGTPPPAPGLGPASEDVPMERAAD